MVERQLPKLDVASSSLVSRLLYASTDFALCAESVQGVLHKQCV